jgi:hypothetical protein
MGPILHSYGQKYGKNHTLGAISKPNMKMVGRGNIDTENT